ncbi:hypothetical protein HYW67_04495 [Candidatus Parcubacteria bacterium]|nr:hypothetical protein [Candidatus Parcubacteria bacterium]
MALQETEEKLYDPDEPFSERERSSRVVGLDEPAEQPFHLPPVGPPAGPPTFRTGHLPMFTPRQRRTLIKIIIVLVMLGLVAGGLYVVFFGRGTFARRDVVVELVGPSEVRGGEAIAYTIKITNRTRVALRDVQASLRLPEGVEALESALTGAPPRTYTLGEVDAESMREREVALRFLGKKDEAKEVRLSVTYQPANLSARFENTADYRFVITSLPFILDLSAPEKAFSGSTVTYRVSYRNISGFALKNTEVRLSYPAGFDYQTASPSPHEATTVWRVDELQPGQGGEIAISGRISGNAGDRREVGASIGVIEAGRFTSYTENVAASILSPALIALDFTVNGVTDYRARPDERLLYRINYRNNSPVALRELIVRARLVGAMFDLTTVQTGGGAADSTGAAITWNAAADQRLALLDPGEGGELSFEVQTKKNFPVRSSSDRNFVASATASIETPRVPPELAVERLFEERTLETKFTTKFTLRTLGYFSEPSAGITNSGPMPPRVGQPTTFTIHWRVFNTSNDASDVRVRGVLGPNVRWTGQVLTKFGPAPQVNERTGEITWQVGSVSAGTGVLGPAAETVFQLELTPSITDIGTTPVLIRESRAVGVDDFTGSSLESLVGELRTNLPDDPTLSAEQGKVQP